MANLNLTFITMDEKTFITVQSLIDFVAECRKKFYFGDEPGFMCDDAEIRAVAANSLNLFLLAIENVEHCFVDNVKCYDRSDIAKLLNQMRAAIRDDDNKLFWAPTRDWKNALEYPLVKLSTMLSPEGPESELKARNMWPLGLAVKEFREGTREVDIPARYVICHVTGNKPDAFFAGMNNGVLAQVQSDKLAQWYVRIDQARNAIEELEAETGNTGAWQLCDMAQKLKASDMFLRAVFDAEKPE